MHAHAGRREARDGVPSSVKTVRMPAVELPKKPFVAVPLRVGGAGEARRVSVNEADDSDDRHVGVRPIGADALISVPGQGTP